MKKSILSILSVIVLVAGFVVAQVITKLWHDTTVPTAIAWNAGVRDADVAQTLVCVFGEDNSIDNPNWSIIIKKSDQPEFYPEPVGQAKDVVLDVTEVCKTLATGTYTWAAAYVDEAGNKSEWATLSFNIDRTSPGAPQGLGKK